MKHLLAAALILPSLGLRYSETTRTSPAPFDQSLLSDTHERTIVADLTFPIGKHLVVSGFGGVSKLDYGYYDRAYATTVIASNTIIGVSGLTVTPRRATLNGYTTGAELRWLFTNF